MRIALAILLVITMSLSGCVYTSANLIRAQGKSIYVLHPAGIVDCKDAAVTIFRQSGTVKTNKDGSVEKPAPMPDIIEGPQTWVLDNAPQSKKSATYNSTADYNSGTSGTSGNYTTNYNAN